MEGQDGVTDLRTAFGQLVVGTQPPAIGDAYQPHKAIDLDWLLAFSEVAEWMEKAFLDVLEEVRGAGWEASKSD